jgi:hypothetical protein
MAYCVECGVKLEDGATKCPLCHREVIAPIEIIGTAINPLFDARASENEKFPSLKYDKTRKGLIELSITFVGVAIVTLLITGIAIKDSFSPWFPIACTILGSIYLFILLFGKSTYTRIGTLFTIQTIITLFTIDIFNGSLTWSLYAIVGVILLYMIAVFPFYKNRLSPIAKMSVMSSVLLVSLFLFDLIEAHSLLWFFPIALPTFLITLAGFLILILRYIYGHPSLSDIVLSIILNISIGTVAGNFFSLRMEDSVHILTWSKSVLIVVVILILFLIANATIRKVRFYFNNKVH